MNGSEGDSKRAGGDLRSLGGKAVFTRAVFVNVLHGRSSVASVRLSESSLERSCSISFRVFKIRAASSASMRLIATPACTSTKSPTTTSGTHAKFVRRRIDEYLADPDPKDVLDLTAE